MFKIQTLNNISPIGLERLPRERYEVASEFAAPDAILVRSADMHKIEIPKSVRAIGRAGAGTNNIPVKAMSDRGVPVWLIVVVVSIVTYLLSYILIRTISRYREYAADRGAALITGAPENLMSALQKISSRISQIPQKDLREVQSMNAFFIIPTNVKSAFGELFLTHPPLEKRLAALERISREMGKI